jgi:hypothetical protein
MLKAEIKSQKKRIRNVKKKSLWSRSLEEVAILMFLFFLQLKIIEIVIFYLFSTNSFDYLSSLLIV